MTLPSAVFPPSSFCYEIEVENYPQTVEKICAHTAEKRGDYNKQFSVAVY